MNELALHILDIVQNSFKAQAKLVKITIDEQKNIMKITIEDNGFGMDQETLKKVTNPFYTSRTTRKVGMGLPLFKEICENTGGSLTIESTKNQGTTIKAIIDKSSIDALPLGNICETILILIINDLDIDIEYNHIVDEKEYIFKTKEIKEILNGLPLTDPSIINWIKEYLRENEIQLYFKEEK